MNVLASVVRVPKTHPFAFGVGFSGVKTSVSDLVVQKFVEQREDIDWKRNAAFAAFGFGYLGCVQYFLYVPVFGRMFPRTAEFAGKPLSEKVQDTRGLAGVLAQVFLDQCLHHPFLYFPVFYATKELLSAGPPDVGRALATWRENFWPDLFALWKIWIPATTLNFAFSPMWLRIPVVASTSLAWTMVLSAMRGAAKSDDVVVMDEQDLDGVARNTDVVLEQNEVDNPVLGAHVSARTMEILARGLARRKDHQQKGDEPEPTVVQTLQRKLTLSSEDPFHLCVTASGADRVGLISLLTHWIYERGGNITDSKMLRMHDQFFIVMHVTAPDERKGTSLRADLLGADPHMPKPLHALEIRARGIGSHAIDHQSKEARLRLTGRDQPGIVAKVTAVFTDLGFNIDELATDTVPAHLDDSPWFLLEVFAHCGPDDTKVAQLDAKLNQLRLDLDCNVELTWTR